MYLLNIFKVFEFLKNSKGNFPYSLTMHLLVTNIHYDFNFISYVQINFFYFGAIPCNA